MKQESKQQWKRPQLIVLGRGLPEESILNACKSSSAGGPKIPLCVDGQKDCNNPNKS